MCEPLAFASNDEEENKKLQLQLHSRLFCSDQENVQISTKHPEYMQTNKGQLVDSPTKCPEHQLEVDSNGAQSLKQLDVEIMCEQENCSNVPIGVAEG